MTSPKRRRRRKRPPAVLITVRIPEDILQQVDARRSAGHVTRTAVMLKLLRDGLLNSEQ